MTCLPRPVFRRLRGVWIGLIALGLGLGAGRSEARPCLGFDSAQIARVLAMGYNLDPGTDAELEAMRREVPDSPAVAVIAVGRLYWAQLYAGWDAARTARFEQAAALALPAVTAYARDHRDDPDAAFAAALVEIMQAIHAIDRQQWWTAYWKSRGPIRVMERLLREDPDRHDAKLVLGMKDCYLARVPGYLQPLAFLIGGTGDLDRGVQRLTEARDRGLFCRADAGFYLAGIRVELTADPVRAQADLAALVATYPGNPLFRTVLARVAQANGDRATALHLTRDLLAAPTADLWPGLTGQALMTQLWCSLGAGDYALTLTTADRAEALAALQEPFARQRPWITHARAEALLGLGRRDEAIARWESIPRSEHQVWATVAGRLRTVRAEDGPL